MQNKFIDHIVHVNLSDYQLSIPAFNDIIIDRLRALYKKVFAFPLLKVLK